MKKGIKKTATIPYRRKREGRTNYRTRLKLLLSRRVRLVVRLSGRNVLAQLVEYSGSGDKVLTTASSKELEKFGWKAARSSLPAAYLVGILVASKGEKLNVKGAILDLGSTAPIAGSRIYAVLAGAVEGGLNIPHGDEVLPSDDRVAGKHIEGYAKQLKIKDPERFKRQFSAYIKHNLDPTAFVHYVHSFKETFKEKIARAP